MNISRREAQNFIKYLCQRHGIPPPLFKPLEETSYNEGEYSNLQVFMKRNTTHVVAFHEFMHYMLHLIQNLDTDEEDNLEHKLINWLCEEIKAADVAYQKFRERRRARKKDIRTDKKQTQHDFEGYSGRD